MELKRPETNSVVGPPPWRYKCRDCSREFQIPVPRGPAEEKGCTCPVCHSSNIEIIPADKSEVCSPGG